MVIIGEENNEVIREFLSSENILDCMVAFIGKNAVHMLRGNNKSIRLICNLDSGGTNPYAIKSMLDLSNIEIRNQGNLHAKIYIGQHEAIISSANLSANGLSLEGEEIDGWIEAGYKVSNIGEVEALKGYFEGAWAEAQPINDEMLDRAKEKWAKRRINRPSTINTNSSLLDALRRKSPTLLDRNIYFVISRAHFSKEAETMQIELQNNNSYGNNADVYEDWNDLPEDAYFIDFHIGPRLGIKYNGLFKSPERKILIQLSESELYLCHEVDDIEGFKFSKDDESVLKLVCTKLLDCPEATDEGFYVDAFEAYDFMFSSNNLTVTDNELRQEFLRLIEECISIGYNPGYFNQMINNSEISAVSTAISLVMQESQEITHGFMRLWEKKRLDLTIEANIIKEPWRHLFDDHVLSKARKRLKKFRYDEKNT